MVLTRSTPTVELSAPDWFAQLTHAFETHGVCQLAAASENAGALREAMVVLAATPINVGVLQFFPVVERIDRASGRILSTLTLREQI
jgi:hypothetical protein